MLSGHQRITWRRNIAENFNRLSRGHERYRRQTDRRTDDDIEFTFAKNREMFIGVAKSFPTGRAPSFFSSKRDLFSRQSSS